jgi:hypothetical protein
MGSAVSIGSSVGASPHGERNESKERRFVRTVEAYEFIER